MRALIFVGHYLPGHRAGGPVRSVSRIVEQEREEHELFVVTRDHDLGIPKRFAGSDVPGWVTVGGARVLYLGSPASLRTWRKVLYLWNVRPDLVYLNSIFSMSFSVLPLCLWLVAPSRPRFLIAPRGELDPGALGVKSRKKGLAKWPLRKVFRSKRVIWHASSELESENIVHWLGCEGVPTVVASVPGALPRSEPSEPLRSDGLLRVAWISRIVPKKDLVSAIHILDRSRVAVHLDVYGPIEDGAYWRSCEAEISGLPPNVTVSYRGVLDPDQVSEVFASSDLFLFPTKGENFGHVISEALSVGCLVLTTTATPWTALLNAGAGLASDDDGELAARIAELAAERAQVRQAGRHKCLTLYRAWFLKDVRQRRSLFTSAQETAAHVGLPEKTRGSEIPGASSPKSSDS